MHALKVVICPKQKHCCFTPKQIFCTGNVMAAMVIKNISYLNWKDRWEGSNENQIVSIENVSIWGG